MSSLANAVTVIVHGPPACGKTRYKQQIAAHFGCAAIVDEWDERRDNLIEGALHLTLKEPADAYRGAQVIAFADLPLAIFERDPDERNAEAVDHPAHYGGADNPYEAIKVIEAWGLGFNLGNTVKYVARAERKGSPLQDLEKARWYLDREIENRKEADARAD